MNVVAARDQGQQQEQTRTGQHTGHTLGNDLETLGSDLEVQHKQEVKTKSRKSLAQPESEPSAKAGGWFQEAQGISDH